jgi:hypothetical protein
MIQPPVGASQVATALLKLQLSKRSLASQKSLVDLLFMFTRIPAKTAHQIFLKEKAIHGCIGL